VDLAVSVGSLRLKNPILTASGTFGFGLEFAQLYDLALLGGMVLKSVTLKPREGNPSPRIAETPAGMLNSIGLQNPGIEALCSDVLPTLEGVDTVVVVSVAGNRLEDFVECTGHLAGIDRVDAVELNVSCPNQASGGMAFGTRPDAVQELTRAVREQTDLPLWVKLTPNVTDIVSVAEAAVAGGADALCLVNTFLGMGVDWRRRKPSIAGLRGRGGVSGPAVKPMALRMVRDVCEAVTVPVVGMGGIIDPGDALEFMVCGATAVQVGTANFVDPLRASRLPAEMAQLLASEGISDVRAIVGTLADTP
jgi:dihydroorotate dehydrogenase (NAD+) catalytic subunit